MSLYLAQKVDPLREGEPGFVVVYEVRVSKVLVATSGELNEFEHLTWVEEGWEGADVLHHQSTEAACSTG